jgi:type II secretory pathway pseudopilin PulG
MPRIQLPAKLVSTIGFRQSAFTLTEILGAVSIAMVIASLAIISAKDSLQAGQRSAVQRELQSLNSALNNYKAAGGTIAPGTPVEDVIALLRQGVKMSDSDYAPLVDDPDLTKRIGDKDYNLAYDDITGFSYVPDGEGDEFVQGGAEISSNPIGEGFVFDPTSNSAIQAALSTLQSLNIEDPLYAQYLQALNSASLLGNVYDSDLTEAGLVFRDGSWLPRALATAEDISKLPDPGPLVSGFNGTPDQAGYFLSLTPAQQASLFRALPVTTQSALIPDIIYGPRVGATDPLTVLLSSLPSGEAGSLLNNLTQEQYEQWLDHNHWYVNPAGLDLHGWDQPAYSPYFGPAGAPGVGITNLAGVPLVQINRTEDAGLIGTDMSGRNLSGLRTLQKFLLNTDLSESNISIAQLTNSYGINGMNLAGTGITREAMQAAVDAIPNKLFPTYWNLDTVTFSQP